MNFYVDVYLYIIFMCCVVIEYWYLVVRSDMIVELDWIILGILME